MLVSVEGMYIGGLLVYPALQQKNQHYFKERTSIQHLQCRGFLPIIEKMMITVTKEPVARPGMVDERQEWVIFKDDDRPIGGLGMDRSYLHSNGTCSKTIFNEYGQRTGSFTTFEDAEIVLSENEVKDYYFRIKVNDNWLKKEVAQGLKPSSFLGKEIDKYDYVILTYHDLDAASGIYGKWFITCMNFQGSGQCTIHSNGKLYIANINEYGQYTGLFVTKQDALKVLKVLNIKKYHELIPSRLEEQTL